MGFAWGRRFLAALLGSLQETLTVKTHFIWSFGRLKPCKRGRGVWRNRITSSIRNDCRGVKGMAQKALSARLERALKAHRRAPTNFGCE